MTLPAADPLAAGFNSERLTNIDAHIKRKYLDTGCLPHAALLIGRGEHIAHHSLQGEARPGQKLGKEHIFRLASMTKPVTSIAFMQLVEQGKVALSDPVHYYLPEFKNLGVFVSGGGDQPFVSRPATQVMRIIDLLRHTSGLTYGFQERTPIDAAYRKGGFERFDGGSMDAFIKALSEIPLQFDPGTSWNYSVSTDVLGAIVERISGLSLEDYFRTHIFAPLGMDDTHFQLPMSKIDRVTDSYVFDSQQRMKPYDPGASTAWAKEPGYFSGGGGLMSTMSDYYRFCRMLLGKGSVDGTRIIGRKTLEMMTANHLPGGGDLTQHSKALFSEAENAGAGFGLGFATTIDSAATGVMGSNGDFYWGGMFSTAFFVDPVEEVIMIFMTQLMPSNIYPVRREIKTMLYAALD